MYHIKTYLAKLSTPLFSFFFRMNPNTLYTYVCIYMFVYMRLYV